MIDENLVSIITPTYNCGHFIAESIKSVLVQTYDNWEMVIVDDCSTDDTKEVVGQFSNDKRIKYHCLKRNSGAAVARNTALKMAKGRWIAFLDSDDLWSPDKLEKQVTFMLNNGIHFSYTQYEEMAENGFSLGKIISGPKKISKLGMYAYCWPGCLTVMYDRDIIGTTQISPIKKNNDYAMWLDVIKKANCFLLNENLAKYRKRSGSISNSNYFSLVKWHYRLFHEALSINTINASLLTMNNLFWGIIKKIFYVKKLGL